MKLIQTIAIAFLALGACAKTPLEAVATEPLTFRTCTFNGAKMPDGDLVTPRGERKPFVRSKGIIMW